MPRARSGHSSAASGKCGVSATSGMDVADKDGVSWFGRALAGMGSRALAEPPRDTRNGLAHFVGRTRIGKADELMTVNRIEIDAGSRSDVRLLQHLLGKFETVRCE